MKICVFTQAFGLGMGDINEDGSVQVSPRTRAVYRAYSVFMERLLKDIDEDNGEVLEITWMNPLGTTFLPMDMDRIIFQEWAKRDLPIINIRKEFCLDEWRQVVKTLTEHDCEYDRILLFCWTSQQKANPVTNADEWTLFFKELCEKWSRQEFKNLTTLVKFDVDETVEMNPTVFPSIPIDIPVRRGDKGNRNSLLQSLSTEAVIAETPPWKLKV